MGEVNVRESERRRSPGWDPRVYQIGILSTLLVYGTVCLDFDVPLVHVATILASTLATQLACTRVWKLPRFDPKSALISGLSLCLLLRTNSLPVASAVAIITIASKFVLRWDGKHLFNPTNFGLVVILCTGSGWVSAGQWGRETFFVLMVAFLGGLVVNRATRGDVTYTFLGIYSALLFGRALWLGDPLSIPLHQLQNGALLVFAFLMISDPKTTPHSRRGRILFSTVVALGAAWVQFGLYQPHGALWALACAALTVPFINRLCPGTRYEWNCPTGQPTPRLSKLLPRRRLLNPPLPLLRFLERGVLASIVSKRVVLSNNYTRRVP